MVIIPMHNIDLIGRRVLELFSGVCDFGQEIGVNHYQDVYSFEDGLSDVWSSWGGGVPQVTEDEAFCGRHSLFVSLTYEEIIITYEWPSIIAMWEFGPRVIESPLQKIGGSY